MVIVIIFIKWQVSSLKKVNIVGLGPGNVEYITKSGIDIIKKCDIAIGGARQLEEVAPLLSFDCEKYTLGKLSDVIEYINNNRDRDIAVIVSGDTGFYSLLTFMRKYYSRDELNVIPGISSYQYLFARIGEVWQDYRLISVHGRDTEYTEALFQEKGIVLLTDNINNPYTIAKNIYEAGHRDVEIVVGERLSYPDEKITFLDIDDYEKLNREFSINVVIVRKK